MIPAVKIAFICLLWVIIWTYSYFMGPKKPTLPKDPTLTILSSAALVLITVFYTLCYSPFLTPLFTLPFLFEIFVLFIMTLSATLCMHTRKKLGNLSPQDIVFAKNPTYTHGGAYRYLNHPMYVAIFGVLACSWLLFPYTLNLMPLAGIVLLFVAKARTE